MTYPGVSNANVFASGPSYPVGSAGPNYTYGYDSMGRPNTLSMPGSQWNPPINNQTITPISGVSYGPAGEMLQRQGLVYETRAYNSLVQVTSVSNNAGSWQYAYPDGSNIGKISSQTVSGEQVQYTYDSLGRLSKAEAPTWGTSYTYDGIGNLLDKGISRGSRSLRARTCGIRPPCDGGGLDICGDRGGCPARFGDAAGAGPKKWRMPSS